MINTKATVEPHGVPQGVPLGGQQLCNKSTGAIPKHSKSNKAVTKPSTNHLDEIVTLPLDDLTATSTSKRNGKDLSLSK